MRPKIESLGTIDISNGSSEDFNQILDYVGSDITSLFNMANINEVNSAEALRIIINNSIFMQKKIYELEEDLASIVRTVQLQETSGYKSIYKSFYDNNMILANGTQQIVQDTQYGIVTIQYQNTNKLLFQRFETEFLKRNINIEFTVDGNTYNTTDRPALLNIIDNDDSTFFIEEFEASTSTTSVEFKIRIELPRHLLPSLTFNALNINPYPIYALDLEDIQYDDVNTSTALRLPTYPESNTNPITMENISETKFVFPLITAESIEFTFTQTNYTQRNNVRTFILGLRNIDLEILRTVTESTSFITKFETPIDEQYFLRVQLPTVTTLNDQNYEEAVTHELWLDAQGNSIGQFGSDLPTDVQTVYIKTTLTKSGQIIPVLKGIQIDYTTK